MNRSLWTGEFVRLAAVNAETDAEPFAAWQRNSEFQRLVDAEIARPRSTRQAREFLEEHQERDTRFWFAIRTLADDRLIGDIELGGIHWTHGEAWLGIGIGDPQYWGRGYGTDAIRMMLRYAFDELNLHRISLDVFEYNRRAFRCYEKLGFVVEGRARHALNRDGRRWDMIYMGILRHEWEGRQR